MMRVETVAAARGRPDGSRGSRGFTLLEVTVTCTFFAVALIGISGGVVFGVRTMGRLQDDQLVKVRSQMYLDRLMSLNYGAATDCAPTGGQLNELFDDDTESGTVTLMSLTRWPECHGGWRFTLSDFPARGVWLVTVTQDLDGNGPVAGTLEEGGELVRIAISFNGQLILSTVRGKE